MEKFSKIFNIKIANGMYSSSEIADNIMKTTNKPLFFCKVKEKTKINNEY